MDAPATKEPIIDLFIYFTGLIVFAEESRPKIPATILSARIGDRGKQPPPRVRALVVDVRNPSDRLHKAGRRCEAEDPVIPHVPVVQFPWKYLQEKDDPENNFRPLPPLEKEGKKAKANEPGFLRNAVAKSMLYQPLRMGAHVRFPFYGPSNRSSAPGEVVTEDPKVPEDDSDSPRRGLWMLEKEILQLDPEMATVETELKVNQSSLSEDFVVPGKGDMESINWVAPVKGIDKFTDPQLKKGITDPLNSAEARERLAAVFLLDRGCLRPAAFASELGHFVAFDVDGTTRAQVSVLELYVQVRGRKVRIISTRFDGSCGRTLELEIPESEMKELEEGMKKGVGGRSRIEVWLLNREWVAIRDQTPARPVDYREVNPEYGFLYDLITDKTRPGDDKFPVAVERRRAREGDDGTYPGSRPCQDATMSKIYFITGGYGEAALSAPCSPMYIRESQG